MITEERIQEQIKELQEFLNKQAVNIKEYKSDIETSIELIDDKAIKTRVGTMYSEALKGNLENVQALAKSLTNDINDLKNKENAG